MKIRARRNIVRWEAASRSCSGYRLGNCRDRRIGHRLKLNLKTVGKGFGFLRVRKRLPPGVTRGRRSRNSRHPFGHPSQRLVFGLEGFECRTPLVVPPLEPTGHRPLQAVDLCSQSGDPGDLLPPPHPVLQAYLIMNASRYRRLRVVTRVTLGSRCCQSLQNGARVLNARVDYYLVHFRIEGNLIFQVSLEVGPVIAPKNRAIRWVLKG